MEKTQNQGKSRYIIVYGVVIWGIGLTVGKLIFHAALGHWQTHWWYYLIDLVVNMLGGLVIGWGLWRFQQRQYRRLKDKVKSGQSGE